MGSAGIFGKVPTHGDFVSAGTGTTTGRSFESWAQMANDRVAELGKRLPPGPIGFIFRDDAGASALVGTLCSSRDSVGRTFPLALFTEVTLAPGLRFPGLPGALASVVSHLAELSHLAPQRPHTELCALVVGTSLPDAPKLEAASSAELARLEEVTLARVLDRIYGEGDARFYGTEVLLRACGSARERGVRNPVVVDVRATSDIELLFWLACVEAALSEEIGAPSVFWDVSAHRALVALGAPDSNMLHVLNADHGQFQRLWPTIPYDSDSAAKARARLPQRYVQILEDPGSVPAQDFVTAISASRAADNRR